MISHAFPALYFAGNAMGIVWKFALTSSGKINRLGWAIEAGGEQFISLFMVL